MIIPSLFICRLLKAEQLETYFSEQFPVRDGLRTVKAETETALLGKADTNGYFKVEDGIYHLEAELNEKNVGRVADSIEKLCTEQFQNADCYVAVIPDKNYYLADKQYPILDYARLDEMIQSCYILTGLVLATAFLLGSSVHPFLYFRF